MTLHEKLIAAGLPVLGNAVEGQTVLFTRPLAAEEMNTYEQIVNPVRWKHIQARIAAGAIPNWATWTLAQWATYYNANISATQINDVADLAGAKVILNKMSTVIDSIAKMLIANRDWDWPDLS